MSVREGVRVDMCRPASALGLCKVERPSSTVHARLEAMVLRARRGTHQGSVDTKTRRPGCNARAPVLENGGMRAVGWFYTGALR